MQHFEDLLHHHLTPYERSEDIPATEIFTNPVVLPSPVRYHSSGFTTEPIHIDGVVSKTLIVSELLYRAFKSSQKIATLQRSPLCQLSVGTIGTYRRVIPRRKECDFSLLEEMRVITAIGLYTRRLCLNLSPVIAIDDCDVITYYSGSTVKLVLYDEGSLDKPQRWLKVVKNGYFVRGCHFEVTVRPTHRTIAVDGIYHEIEGRASGTSTQGLVPQRFVSLFEDAVDDSIIVW